MGATIRELIAEATSYLRLDPGTSKPDKHARPVAVSLPGNPYADQVARAEEILDALQLTELPDGDTLSPGTGKAEALLAGTPPPERKRLLLALAVRQLCEGTGKDDNRAKLIESALDPELGFTGDEAALLLAAYVLVRGVSGYPGTRKTLGQATKFLKALEKKKQITPRLLELLREASCESRRFTLAEMNHLVEFVAANENAAAPTSAKAPAAKKAAAKSAAKSLTMTLSKNSAWATAMIAELNAMAPEKNAKWIRLLNHAAQIARTGAPSATWAKEAVVVVDEVGGDALAEALGRWLPKFYIDPDLDNDRFMQEPEDVKHLDEETTVLKALFIMAGPHLPREFAPEIRAYIKHSEKLTIPIRAVGAAKNVLISLEGIDGPSRATKSKRKG